MAEFMEKLEEIYDFLSQFSKEEAKEDIHQLISLALFLIGKKRGFCGKKKLTEKLDEFIKQTNFQTHRFEYKISKCGVEETKVMYSTCENAKELFEKFAAVKEDYFRIIEGLEDKKIVVDENVEKIVFSYHYNFGLLMGYPEKEVEAYSIEFIQDLKAGKNLNRRYHPTFYSLFQIVKIPSEEAKKVLREWREILRGYFPGLYDLAKYWLKKSA